MTEADEPEHKISHLRVRAHPFFLIGALFAILMMALWLPWFLGFIQVPSAWPAQAWFNHEIVFGLAPAMIAGYLLTVIADQTGSKPLRGGALAALAALWLAGRVSVAMSAHLDAATAATLSVAFLIALATLAAFGLLKRRHWSDLILVALVVALGLANLLYHYEMWEFGRTKSAQNLGITAALLPLILIATRIAAAGESDPLNVASGVQQARFQRFDVATWAMTAVALSVWAGGAGLLGLSIDRQALGALLLLASLMNLATLVRLANARLVGFQVAYVFAAAGFALTALGVMWNDYDFATGGMHAWTIGAIGAMALAIATWTSRARRAPAAIGTIILYVLAFIAGAAWTVAGLSPQWTLPLLPASGVVWIAAFGGFIILYGRAGSPQTGR